MGGMTKDQELLLSIEAALRGGIGRYKSLLKEADDQKYRWIAQELLTALKAHNWNFERGERRPQHSSHNVGTGVPSTFKEFDDKAKPAK